MWPGAGLAQGQRGGRKDGRLKMIQSRIANGVRGRILRDATRDTGCGLKVFRRAVYLRLPYFDALHRFMPALVAREFPVEMVLRPSQLRAAAAESVLLVPDAFALRPHYAGLRAPVTILSATEIK